MSGAPEVSMTSHNRVISWLNEQDSLRTFKTLRNEIYTITSSYPPHAPLHRSGGLRSVDLNPLTNLHSTLLVENETASKLHLAEGPTAVLEPAFHRHGTPSSDSSDPAYRLGEMAIPKSPPSTTQAKAMRRVLSRGSTGSAGGAVTTPTMTYAPLSPASGSGGTRTPTAKKARLPGEDMIPPVPGPSAVNGAGVKRDEELVDDLDGLQVRSPPAMSQPEQPRDQEMEGMTETMKLEEGPQQLEQGHPSSNSGTERQYRNPDRSFSSSDESSSSETYHPIPPSQLGSMYGAEGFPIPQEYQELTPALASPYQMLNQPQPMYPPAYPSTFFGYSNMPKSDSPEQALTPAAAAAAAIAKADEAIKALNGTSTVYQGGVLPPVDGAYQLPRGYANFVRPQNKMPDHAASRQSSTSSSATEDSTSSEESDWCIPSIEWVRRDVPGVGSPGLGQTGGNGGLGLPQMARNGNGIQPGHGVGAGNSRRGGSPARMPPPQSTRVTSPRIRQNNGLPHPPLIHQQTLPVGASAHTPAGLRQSSALPQGARPDAADDDDDDQTIGHREQSPSTSSQSARSGLDLLWRAATHTSSDTGEDKESYEEPYDSKGKRKAGAEAVDQWRKAGIPSGVGNSRHRRQSTTSTEDESAHDWTSRSDYMERQKEREKEKERERAEAKVAAPPPKKRRRSSALDEVDPALRDVTAQTPLDDALDQSSESSFVDDGAGESGSEYGENTHGRRPSTRGGRAAVTGRRTARGGRQSISISTGHGGGAGSKTGTPTMGQAMTLAGATSAISPAKKAQAAAGGSGKKTASPSGAGKGGGARRSSGGAAGGQIPAGGVQCEYVNPLPPFNRCQDIFTRKYDLPRHMARHARREGELVYEGKLAEDKATLWQTIKDKPKVSCPNCGESFTRMDALKRHQAKQNH